MGGVATDRRGRTSLAGLWAAGEVACTGAHGANRLASNSLLEAAVYAARVAEDIKALPVITEPLPEPAASTSRMEQLTDASLERSLRKLMSHHVGVVRDATGLKQALREIARIERAASRMPQLRNMTTAALMITAAALKREESRGGHYRSDFPNTDPKQATRTYLTLDDARQIAAEAGKAHAPELAVA
jgi:L-aspartate oxidase